ncbi:hypothetical protein HK104_002349 [Borealophlyctis nickersoniae]|nr:hypothetical protein HK104_002349 [Borealophlyctis nickersoniae]
MLENLGRKETTPRVHPDVEDPTTAQVPPEGAPSAADNAIDTNAPAPGIYPSPDGGAQPTTTNPPLVSDDQQAVPAAEQTKNASPDAHPNLIPTHSTRFWTRRKRNACFVCLAIAVVLVVVLVPILIKVVHPKVSQDALNSAQMEFVSLNLTQPTASNFSLGVLAKVTNAGHSDAEVGFAGNMKLFWVSVVDGLEKQLLEFPMSTFGVDKGNGQIAQNVSSVNITDPVSFAIFNKVLLGTPSFTWRLLAPVNVHAATVTSGGLTLDKTVVVAGMNRLAGTYAREFNLLGVPSATASTPINMTVTITNPSPVGIQVSDLNFNITEPTTGTFLGTAVTTVNPSFLNSGTIKLNMLATLVPLGQIPAPLVAKLTPVLGGIGTVNLTVTCTSVWGGQVGWLSAALVGTPLALEFGKGG